MDFQRFLSERELYRIQFLVMLHNSDKSVSREVKLIVDTGNINTVISKNLASMFSIEKLADGITFNLGGKQRTAERHVLPYIEFSQNFIIQNVVVEAVSFEPDYELYNSILLGLEQLTQYLCKS